MLSYALIVVDKNRSMADCGFTILAALVATIAVMTNPKLSHVTLITVPKTLTPKP